MTCENRIDSDIQPTEYQCKLASIGWLFGLLSALFIMITVSSYFLWRQHKKLELARKNRHTFIETKQVEVDLATDEELGRYNAYLANFDKYAPVEGVASLYGNPSFV